MMIYYLCFGPLFYINRHPHIGHIYNYSLSLMKSRMFIVNGIHSNVISGTDEHGIKVYDSFSNYSSKPSDDYDFESYIRDMRKVFYDNVFNNSKYIECSKSEVPAIYNTHTSFHCGFANCIFDYLYDLNLIYAGKYSGYYCTKDEKYLDNNEYKSLDEDYIKKFVIIKDEDGYYMKLTDGVKAKIVNNIDNIIIDSSMRDQARNIVKNAKDVFISRIGGTEHSIKLLKNDNHSIYVWFEALLYYLNMFNIYDSSRVKPYIVIGKDILSFHVSLLMHLFQHVIDIQDVNIMTHGMILQDSKKISKSYNNDDDSMSMLNKYNKLLTSYLLSCSTKKDIEISSENIESYANFLRNNVRNLYKRFFSLYKAYDQLVQPSHFIIQVKQEDSFQFILQIVDDIKNNYVVYDGSNMYELLNKCALFANKYITDNEFWNVSEDKSVKFFSISIIIRVMIMIEYVLGTPEINKIIDELSEHPFMSLCILSKILQMPKDIEIFNLKY